MGGESRNNPPVRTVGRTAGPFCWERSRSGRPAAPVHTPQVWPSPPKYRPRQGPRRRPGPSLPRRGRVARRPRAGSRPRFQPEPRHVNGASRDTPRAAAASGGAAGPSRRRRRTRPHSPWRPAAPASLPASTVRSGSDHQSKCRAPATPSPPPEVTNERGRLGAPRRCGKRGGVGSPGA